MVPITETEEAETTEAEQPPRPQTFSISEAALFLGRSTQWLRWRSEQLTAEYPGEFEVARGENNYRQYDLDTIQKLADLLYKAKRISTGEHKDIIRRVNAFRK